ncbi:hypothetical protein AAHC03_04677 [Spirometra sp. Aus1]
MCTYANWPKSRKCTLCSSPKDLPRIEDEMKRLDVSASPTPSEDHQSGWACSRCTFINRFNLEKCLQCDSARSLDVTGRTAASACVQESLLSSIKWRCNVCTYENWPKSRKCVMCYASFPLTSHLAMEEPQTTALSDQGLGGLAPTDSLVSFKPTQSVSASHPDILWLDACKAVVVGDVGNFEKYLRSVEDSDRRLTKRECHMLDRWFAQQLPADRPIVTAPEAVGTSSRIVPMSHNVSEPVDVSRSSREQRPAFTSPFRPGHTLLDIARAYRRSNFVDILRRERECGELGCSMDPDPLSLQSCFPFNSSVEAAAAATAGSFESPPPSPHGADLRAHRFFSKRSFCQTSPYLAKELRRILASGIRQRKGEFPCDYMSEWGTFFLPAEIWDLPPTVQSILFSELLDSDAQTELEERSKAINWWVTGGNRPTSHLFALWNRTDGDCLLDSLLQASWGIFDKQKTLRQALSESLIACESAFFRVWRDYETVQAADQYRLDELQLLRDWRSVLDAARQPRGSLEQIHIFVLCHILRRPVIVYGVKYINNYRDEPIGISNFQGIYLPLLWDRSFCSRNPLALGYTRGHFTALLPVEPLSMSEASDRSSMPPPTPREEGFSVVEAGATANTSDAALPSSAEPQPSPRSSPLGMEDATATISGGGQNLLGGVGNSGRSSKHADGPSSCGRKGSCSVYLPLFDRQGQPLPVHFVSQREVHSPGTLLREHLEVITTRRGLFVARLRLQPSPHHQVRGMVNDWLSVYRNLPDMCDTVLTAATGTTASATVSFSTDGTCAATSGYTAGANRQDRQSPS